jgi:hypothetical protein
MGQSNYTVCAFLLLERAVTLRASLGTVMYLYTREVSYTMA